MSDEEIEKVQKSLKWVVNQIPTNLGDSNDEKMLKCIRLYCENGAATINYLKSERDSAMDVAHAERGCKMNEELKPCPFCGGKARTQSYPCDYPNWNTRAGVYCDSCRANIEVLGNINTVERDQEEAINRWNRRV